MSSMAALDLRDEKMTIDDLNIFVTVAQTLNFSRAAELLHFSQPTLSRRISELENELGRKLFIRTTRKVELTEFGQYFLAEADNLLKDYNHLLDQINNLGRSYYGRIIIGTPVVMTDSFLPGAIESFRKDYPRVDIDIRTIEPGMCVNLLRHNVIDIGFFASTDSEIDCSQTAYRQETISSGQIVMVTGRSHKFAKVDKIQPESLINEKVYLTNRNSTPYLWASITKLFVDNGISTENIEEIDSPYAISMMVEAGLGVTFMAENLVKELGNHDRLHTARLKGIDLCSNLNMIWNQSHNIFLPYFIESVSRQIRNS